MERPMFFFEYALLRAVSPESPDTAIKELAVHKEYFSRPRTENKQWFNTDFMVQFVDKLPENFESSAIPIRQNSFGAEIFIVNDEDQRPIRAELLDGECFPRSSFNRELREIDNLITSVSGLDRVNDVRSMPFLRVFDLEKCILFMASTTTDIRSLNLLSAKAISYQKHEIHVRNNPGVDTLIEGVVHR